MIGCKGDDPIVEITDLAGVGPVDVDEQLHSSQESRRESLYNITVTVFCPVPLVRVQLVLVG